MTKRMVVRVAARGYVDGRYIGEEKEVIEAIDPSGRGKRGRKKNVRGSAKGGGFAEAGKPRRGKKTRTAGDADSRGNRAEPAAGSKRSRGARRGPVDGNAIHPTGAGAAAGAGSGQGQGRTRNQSKSRRREPTADTALPGNATDPRRTKRNRGGKKTPFRVPGAAAATASSGRTQLISEVAEARRWGDEAKSGQFAEALATEARVKRERLHKVLAQSGHGSRRDMEIMISSGRVMVNGIVATTGTSVSPSDAVMVDHRLVKLKFNEELPRILLYHKPEGEIVTTDDPGNRITVFDNLPRVENGKWISIGRLDINTSGLLIFTTNGEFANRLMHPRYEVEREYAVRLLGELSDEDTERLLSGISLNSVDDDRDQDTDEDEVVETDRPAKFDSIDKRGGEGVNQWYHVVIKEGRNREVRRMFEAVGLTVSRLIRVRFGKIALPQRLARGRMMELDPSQVRAALRWVGMEADGPLGTLPGLDVRPPPRAREAAEPGDGVSTDQQPAQANFAGADDRQDRKRGRKRRPKGAPRAEQGQEAGVQPEVQSAGVDDAGQMGSIDAPATGEGDSRSPKRRNNHRRRGRTRVQGAGQATGQGQRQRDGQRQGDDFGNVDPSAGRRASGGGRAAGDDDSIGNRMDAAPAPFSAAPNAASAAKPRKNMRNRRRGRRGPPGSSGSSGQSGPSGGEPNGNV